MQIRVSSGDGSPIYLQIINQVKYLAASGRLTPGEQLPPVRKLAEQLLVNPNTVARAYRELEQAGIVESRRGAGVFVSQTLESPLARRQRTKILSGRIDMLLVEAQQMGVDLESLVKLLRQRHRQIRQGADS